MRAWLQFTIKQFKITLTQDIERIFDEDGKQLLRLNEIDFVNRIPEVIYTPYTNKHMLHMHMLVINWFYIIHKILLANRKIFFLTVRILKNDRYIHQAGSILFAQLEIWKASRCCGSDTLRQTQSTSTNHSDDLSPWNVSECNDATGTGKFL